jgi:hypothetical protein
MIIKVPKRRKSMEPKNLLWVIPLIIGFGGILATVFYVIVKTVRSNLEHEPATVCDCGLANMSAEGRAAYLRSMEAFDR